MWVCDGCRSIAALRFDQCRACRAWGTCRRATEAEAVARVIAQKPKHTATLADVAAMHTERLETGLADWDEAFGGGLARGSLVLVWGKAGSGKTTELLRVVSTLGGTYGTSERGMPPEVLRLFADNAKIDPASIVPHELERVADVGAMVRAHNSARVHVVDSVQGFEIEGVGDIRAAKKVLREVTRVCKSTGATVIVVCHAGTDGRNRAGPSRFDHDVDTTIALERRAIFVSKNRFGPFPIRVPRAHPRPTAKRTRALRVVAG